MRILFLIFIALISLKNFRRINSSSDPNSATSLHEIRMPPPLSRIYSSSRVSPLHNEDSQQPDLKALPRSHKQRPSGSVFFRGFHEHGAPILLPPPTFEPPNRSRFFSDPPPVVLSYEGPSLQEKSSKQLSSSSLQDTPVRKTRSQNLENPEPSKEPNSTVGQRDSPFPTSFEKQNSEGASSINRALFPFPIDSWALDPETDDETETYPASESSSSASSLSLHKMGANQILPMGSVTERRKKGSDEKGEFIPQGLGIILPGGGARGVIPATVLREIEKIHKVNVLSQMNIGVATSTGSLLMAMALARNPAGEYAYKLEDIKKAALESSPSIFRSSRLRNFTSLWGYRKAQYSRKNLDSILDHYLGGEHLDFSTLHRPNPLDPSRPLRHVMVTTYDVNRGSPYLFSSQNASEGHQVADPNAGSSAWYTPVTTRSESATYFDFKLKDVVKASSAAPTKFKPVEIYSKENTRYTFVDGGVASNNPGSYLLQEIEKQGYNKDDWLIASFGTGRTFQPFNSQKRKGGVKDFRNIKGLINTMMAAQDDLAARELSTAKYAFIFQPTLEPSRSSMDNTSESQLAYLSQVAEDIVQSKKQDIEKLIMLMEKIPPERHPDYVAKQ